mgnify:CR=1 FL=1
MNSMSRRTCRWTAAFVTTLFGLAAVPTVEADDPPVYTAVAQWQIARPLWNAYEKDLILDALKSARGNKAKAARLLGTTERILAYAVRKHDVDPARFRR